MQKQCKKLSVEKQSNQLFIWGSVEFQRNSQSRIKARKIAKKIGNLVIVITIHITDLVAFSAFWAEYPLGAMLQVQEAA